MSTFAPQSGLCVPIACTAPQASRCSSDGDACSAATEGVACCELLLPAAARVSLLGSTRVSLLGGGGAAPMSSAALAACTPAPRLPSIESSAASDGTSESASRPPVLRHTPLALNSSL
eukprot:6154655-Prymnesium_polylepis.1